MSEFQFNCPECNSLIQAEEEWRGQKSQCPVCGKEIIIQPKIELKVVKEVSQESKKSEQEVSSIISEKNKCKLYLHRKTLLKIGVVVCSCLLLLVIGFLCFKKINPYFQKWKKDISLFAPNSAISKIPELKREFGEYSIKEVKTMAVPGLGLQMSFYAKIHTFFPKCKIIFWNNKGRVQEFGVKTNTGLIIKLPVDKQTIENENGITKYQFVVEYTPQQYIDDFVQQYPVVISFKIEGFGNGQYAEVALSEHHIHNFKVLSNLFKDDQRIFIAMRMHSSKLVSADCHFYMIKLDKTKSELDYKELSESMSAYSWKTKESKEGKNALDRYASAIDACKQTSVIKKKIKEGKNIKFKVKNGTADSLHVEFYYWADGILPGPYAVYAEGRCKELKITYYWFFLTYKKFGKKLDITLTNNDSSFLIDPNSNLMQY